MRLKLWDSLNAMLPCFWQQELLTGGYIEQPSIICLGPTAVLEWLNGFILDSKLTSVKCKFFHAPWGPFIWNMVYGIFVATGIVEWWLAGSSITWSIIWTGFDGVVECVVVPFEIVSLCGFSFSWVSNGNLSMWVDLWQQNPGSWSAHPSHDQKPPGGFKTRLFNPNC